MMKYNVICSTMSWYRHFRSHRCQSAEIKKKRQAYFVSSFTNYVRLCETMRGHGPAVCRLHSREKNHPAHILSSAVMIRDVFFSGLQHIAENILPVCLRRTENAQQLPGWTVNTTNTHIAHSSRECNNKYHFYGSHSHFLWHTHVVLWCARFDRSVGRSVDVARTTPRGCGSNNGIQHYSYVAHIKSGTIECSIPWKTLVYDMRVSIGGHSHAERFWLSPLTVVVTWTLFLPSLGNNFGVFIARENIFFNLWCWLVALLFFEDIKSNERDWERDALRFITINVWVLYLSTDCMGNYIRRISPYPGCRINYSVFASSWGKVFQNSSLMFRITDRFEWVVSLSFPSCCCA